MITTGTVFGNPGGGAANVHVVPAAVPALMMPGAPFHGTSTTVFVPTTCSASVCAGNAFARVTLPSPVQVALNKWACALLTGSALAPLAATRLAAPPTASARRALFMLSLLLLPRGVDPLCSAFDRQPTVVRTGPRVSEQLHPDHPPWSWWLGSSSLQGPDGTTLSGTTTRPEADACMLWRNGLCRP